MVYGTNGDPQPCNGTPILYQYLQAGTYRVFIDATGGGGSQYSSNWNSPPTVNVQAGQFVDGSNPWMVQLFRN
jgi:hypothetical protein